MRATRGSAVRATVMRMTVVVTGVSASVVLVGGTAAWLLERDVPGGTFGSWGDALWWALTSARGVRPDTVWRPWQVEKKIRETDDVVTFVVKRVDDRLVKTSLSGQFVTVLMPVPDGIRQPRQYSLTRADDGEHRQFSVKRVYGVGKPDGEVSTLLHDTVGLGDVLTLSLPYGGVVLDDAGRPVVFLSAGIGIAPMAGMLSHLVTAGSGLSITLLHADVDEGTFALRRQVGSDVLALRNASIHLWYEKDAHSNEPVDSVHHGMMDLGAVEPPADATYYMCGPLPFMQALRSALVERAGRARCRSARHPVRSVRPGPVAGRPRLTRHEPSSDAALTDRCGRTRRPDSPQLG